MTMLARSVGQEGISGRHLACLAVALILVVQTSVSHAAVLELEGTITAIDATVRTVSIARTTANGDKILKVEVAPRAGDLSALKVGDAITFSYDPEDEIVTVITTESPSWLFYDFMCLGVTPEKTLAFVSDSEVRCMAGESPGNKAPFVLVSGKQYGPCVFRCEFFYNAEAMEGNPMVGVASPLPPMKGNTFADRFPKAIEVKLWHRGFGSMLLPNTGFKAEMAYGQAREGRVVPVLKQQAPARSGWNSLEIAVKDDKAIVVTGNGVMLNSLAQVEVTTGHIVVFPPSCDFRIRNASIETTREKKSLPFSNMRSVSCR